MKGAGGRGKGQGPPVSPIQNFEKIGPHLRLQDTKCSSINMPPRKSGAPLVPPENLTLVTPLLLDIKQLNP